MGTVVWPITPRGQKRPSLQPNHSRCQKQRCTFGDYDCMFVVRG